MHLEERQKKRFHFLHVVETRGIIGEGWTGRARVLLERLGQNGHQWHLFGAARGDGWSVQKTAFFLHLDKRRQKSTKPLKLWCCML